MPEQNLNPTTPPHWWEYLLPSNRHLHEPFFESNGPCWCGKGPDHVVHRSTAPLADTALGAHLGARRDPPTGQPPS